MGTLDFVGVDCAIVDGKGLGCGMKVEMLPPFLDGGVMKEHLGRFTNIERPVIGFDGVSGTGGDCVNERSAVARGIEDGDMLALLEGRGLSQLASGGTVDGVAGASGSTRVSARGGWETSSS